MAVAVRMERMRFILSSSEGNLAADAEGIGGNVVSRRVHMADLDVVIVELKLQPIGGIPVQAQGPDILVAAGHTSCRRAFEGQEIQIDVAEARCDFPGPPAALAQRMGG